MSFCFVLSEKYFKYQCALVYKNSNKKKVVFKDLVRSKNISCYFYFYIDNKTIST